MPTVQLPTAWPYVRALLITFVLFVQLVSAAPREPFNHERLARPEGERFVASLRQALGWLGLRPRKREVVDALIDISAVAVDARNHVIAPLRPLRDLTATHQQWGLFISPKREAFGILVQARAADGWHTIHRACQACPSDAVPQSGARVPMLRYRRLRGMYNPSIKRGPRANYEGFANWLARELLTAHAEYRTVRVGMERLSIGAPGEPLRRAGLQHVIAVERSGD